MNLDQGRYELSHSSCSTFAHDRGKNNAPDRLQKRLVPSLLLHIMAISFSRVTPPLLKKTLPPCATDVIYWARENISVMEWVDAMGRED